MQSGSSKHEEETPSLFWGSDPVFLAFAKLYIRDIVNLKESCQVPGVFFYNGHPIRQVDILGTVIGVRERDAFYSYGVDDSTGVINCICWKKLNDTESSSAAPSARESALPSQLKKLREAIEQRTKIEIGDIIRIRGFVHTFREDREVRATLYYKVDDPVCNIQIARMRELPTLYRKVYDRPFHCPALEKGEALSNNPSTLDLVSLTNMLSKKIKEFLLEKRIQTFYHQELEMEASLLSLANQPVIHSANCEQVTREDKELHEKIHHIIQEDCQKPNHVEKGCHFRHILACARLSLSPNLSEAVLQQVLELLEDQSEVISTMEHYYIAF
ncbi:CST complex subunit STN1 isoform X2 [Erinaceus europaeus]|uniref:CST complex subunit STN1 n=1 Tax=Erinaceus europaeus TaxID=9365 RepID=A0ABM3VSQ9_ERIEU|nr:CST complex subunit STN1 isoform X2 [Erinaceus europaeus]